MKKVSVSVPGKVFLMGEHAVVYGKPALLSAVNLRLAVTVSSSEAFQVISNEPTDHAEYAVRFLLDRLHVEGEPNITIRIDSQIPAGFHLGSSAALAAGLSGALFYFYKQLWNPVKINELAYEIEKKSHGTPSGADNTAVTMGGFIWYRKELEFLKSIWQLPFKPHTSLNHFFLLNTGRSKESTGELVARVRHLYDAKPAFVQRLLDINETQTKRVAVALKEGNEPELLDAMRLGERTLEGMDVVSRKAISLIRKIEKAGGAAKILGGGGKEDGVGFLLCYHHAPKIFKEKLQFITLGEDGIRLETK